MCILSLLQSCRSFLVQSMHDLARPPPYTEGPLPLLLDDRQYFNYY